MSGHATPALLASLAEWRREARRHLERANAALTNVPESLKPAFLPLALVEPYLRAIEKRGRDPFRSSIRSAPMAPAMGLVAGPAESGTRGMMHDLSRKDYRSCIDEETRVASGVKR